MSGGEKVSFKLFITLIYPGNSKKYEEKFLALLGKHVMYVW